MYSSWALPMDCRLTRSARSGVNKVMRLSNIIVGSSTWSLCIDEIKVRCISASWGERRRWTSSKLSVGVNSLTGVLIRHSFSDMRNDATARRIDSCMTAACNKVAWSWRHNEEKAVREREKAAQRLMPVVNMEMTCRPLRGVLFWVTSVPNGICL